MRKRRSFTAKEKIETLENWMGRHQVCQADFLEWLAKKGILITPQYLNDVLHKRRAPGPKFKLVFREITGITLVDGWIEADAQKKTV